MLKIGWTTGYAYLSCSIVALNLERSRVTLAAIAPSVHLPPPPFPSSIWRELTTRRLHGQSLEPQGWLEVCLKLRHWPDSVINSIYRCARVCEPCDEQVRSTDTARACMCVCVCTVDTRMKRCWPRFYWGKGNRESKIERRGKKIL